MKTRSNMPLFVVECENVKALSDDQIDLLRCGDYLVKKDASGEHAYKVTFKSATGMCITYHDASVIETQSYDKVDGHWVYNSEDKTPNLLDAQTEDDVEGIVKDLVEGGTLDNAKPIYIHPISFVNSSLQLRITCLIFNNDPTPFDNSSFGDWLDNLYTSLGATARIMCSGAFKANQGNEKLTIASYLGRGSAGFFFIGVDIDGTYNSELRFTNKSTFVNALSEFNDPVNKIN